MQIPTKGLAIALSAAAVTAGVSWLFSQSVPRASAAPATAPTSGRIAGHPDFSGVWEANNTANWDLLTHEARPLVAQQGLTPGSVVPAAPVIALGSMAWMPGGLGVVEGDAIPYQPWAAQRKKDNQEHWIDR